MNLKKILLPCLVALMFAAVFGFVWYVKIVSILVFLAGVYFTSRGDQRTEPALYSVLHILVYGIYPLVFLVSIAQINTQRVVISLFYIPVILKVVRGVVARVYENNKDTGYMANLAYLYAVPLIIFLPWTTACTVLGVYGVAFLFDWEKYFLKQIPVWERVVHIVGLSAILIAISYYL